MNYVYAAIWFAIGLMLMIRLGREGKRFYFAGGVFLLLGAWWLFMELFPGHPFFNGWMGWVFKIVLGVSLVVLCLIFLQQNQKQTSRRSIPMPRPRSRHQIGQGSIR